MAKWNFLMVHCFKENGLMAILMENYFKVKIQLMAFSVGKHLSKKTLIKIKSIILKMKFESYLKINNYSLVIKN